MYRKPSTPSFLQIPYAKGMRVNSNQTREALLQQFADWCAANITGDEKGQAQIFLDRLFQAFGQRGSLDVGGTAEMRIRKSAEDGGAHPSPISSGS